MKLKRRSLKKLSQEFSRTESRVLVALSKRVEFLLSPQVQICFVAVPGTSRNNNSENLEPTGDRSLNDPCPEVVFSACHTSNLNDSDQEEAYHRCDASLTQNEHQGSFSSTLDVYVMSAYCTF